MKEFLIILGLIIVAAAIKTALDERKNRKKFLQEMTDRFGAYEPNEMSPLRMDRVTHYHSFKKKENVIDDITFKDLNLEALYKKINVCRTFYGEEVLYDILRSPEFEEAPLKERDELVSFLYDNPDVAAQLSLYLSDIGREDVLPLCDCMSELEQLKSRTNLGRMIFTEFLCFLAGIGSVVLIFINPMAGFFAFFAVLFINLCVYFYRQRRIEGYARCIISVIRLIDSVRYLAKLSGDDVAGQRIAGMNSLCDKIASIKKGSFLLVSGRSGTGNLTDVVLDYFRMYLHLDLLRFYTMLGEVTQKKDDIIALSEMAGELDACVALASYRKSLVKWCRPKFTGAGKDGLYYKAEGLYHPLVKACVENDADFSKCVLLTGSNASGKSTYLRSVALGALMGQTIYTVCAGSYEAPFFVTATSMAVSDDVLVGDSYYMAEIKSLKRIMDLSGQGVPLLCVIDEVLRGTNTAERVAASTEILLQLSKKSLCFAATHDLELAGLLEDSFDNYHFSEDVDTDSGDISFGYKLMRGFAKSRNAIKLLILMGYDEEITDRAIDRCRTFLEDGVWKKI